MSVNIMDNENIKLETVDEIESLSRYIPHKLTPFQIKVLDNQLYSMKSTMWNQTLFRKFDNGVDVKRLKRAIMKVFNHHDTTATRIYLDDDGNFMQQYAPGFLDKLEIEIVTEEELAEIRKTLVAPFKILNSPLMRCRLFKTPEAVYWFVDMHHLIVDGSSGYILVDEVMKVYENENVELPRDYYFANMWLDYQNTKLPRYQEAKEYYQNTYGNVDWYNIPAPDIDTRENTNGVYETLLDIKVKDISAAEKRCRITRARIANAACLLALYKYSGKNDVLMTWIFNNRTAELRRNAVGLLIKELPVAAHINELETVADLYTSINKQMKATMKYLEYDYMLLNESALHNDSIEVNYRIAVFDVMETPIELDGHKSVPIALERSMDAAEARFEMDIYEFVPEGKEEAELSLAILHMASIYKPETVSGFAEIYKSIFQKLVKAEKTDSITSILAD